jgi:uncharacterized protein YodC (DUF2158 family)
MNVGDVVQLKNKIGPLMTVDRIDADGVKCIWFNLVCVPDNWEFRSGIFVEGALEKQTTSK